MDHGNLIFPWFYVIVKSGVYDKCMCSDRSIENR